LLSFSCRPVKVEGSSLPGSLCSLCQREKIYLHAYKHRAVILQHHLEMEDVASSLSQACLTSESNGELLCHLVDCVPTRRKGNLH